MKLDFAKISPSENMTALITSDVPPADYARYGNTIMDYAYVHAEQAGFIVDPVGDNAALRLAMSGGEFCGNAVLAAAAYATYKGICTDGQFVVESSGAESPLLCEVKTKSPILYEAKAEMPQALSMEETVIPFHNTSISGTLVQLEGITQFITKFWPDQADFHDVFQAITKVVEDKAIGIIPFRQIKDQTYEIKPFVGVTETGVAGFERSCGSGTLALGIYLADKLGQQTVNVQQPGGMIHAEIGNTNYISTDVQITCEGVVHLPD